MSTSEVRPRRCTMFLPGSRPDRFAKAMDLDVDTVIIDLEDAVAPPLKDEGREKCMPLFAQYDPDNRPRAGVRINSIRSQHGIKDMLAVLELERPPAIVMLPKIDSADEVRWVDELLSEAQMSVELYALIETNRGLHNAMEIAAATPRLTAVVFGAVDMSAALGAENEWESLHYARSRVVHATAAAGVDALDVPHLDLEDGAGLQRDAEAGKRLGFAGKFAIHPTQVAAINKAYSPDAAAIERARMIIDAFANEPTGLLVIDGKLIEKPVIRSMQRVLAIAEAIGAG